LSQIVLGEEKEEEKYLLTVLEVVYVFRKIE
jgi:hypothetical protein